MSQDNKTRQKGATPAPGTRVSFSGQYQDLVEVWARDEYDASTRAEGRQPDNDPMAISRFWSHRAMVEIRAAPLAWARLMTQKCWLIAWNVEVPNNKDFTFLQGEFLWLRVLPVRWVVLLLLRERIEVWAAGPGLATRIPFSSFSPMPGISSAATVAFFICDRYRYPIWPAMAVFGGGGLAAGIGMIRGRQWRELGWVLAGMAFLAALSLHNWFGVKLPNFAHDLQFRSSAWYNKGRFQEALADIDRSIALDPLDAGSLQQRGNVLFALGRMEEAGQACRTGSETRPGRRRDLE